MTSDIERSCIHAVGYRSQSIGTASNVRGDQPEEKQNRPVLPVDSARPSAHADGWAGRPWSGGEVCDREGRVVMMCTAAHDTPAVTRSFPRGERDLARFDCVREGAADASWYTYGSRRVSPRRLSGRAAEACGSEREGM